MSSSELAAASGGPLKSQVSTRPSPSGARFGRGRGHDSNLRIVLPLFDLGQLAAVLLQLAQRLLQTLAAAKAGSKRRREAAPPLSYLREKPRFCPARRR